MTKNINLYKKLYEEKKYEELIYKIENLEKVKSAQLLHILGICKLSKKNISNNDKLSAREDFRKAFESENNSNIGIEEFKNARKRIKKKFNLASRIEKIKENI